MGQDKALISWQGVPLLQRVCQAAAVCCSEIYLLTPWPHRYQNLLIGNYFWLQETQPGQGPLVALAQGLEQIPAAWILLLACDLPQLQAPLLQAWASQLPQTPLTTLAVVPYQPGGWEPLCGFYRREALPELEQFIHQGGRSFQQWLSQMPVQPLPVGPEAAPMFWNCNTPADLQQAELREYRPE